MALNELSDSQTASLMLPKALFEAIILIMPLFNVG
jgi:hypothetical protein